jgi:ribonucleoside-diphosphate reductase alpha chain
VVHPLFKKFVAEGKSVDHFQGAMDISPESHLKMQAVCQAHIDGSISKTINLPASATIEGLFELTLKYLDQLKGLTVYRDGSRGASPLTPLSLEEAKRIATEEVETELLEHQCSGGSCSL